MPVDLAILLVPLLAAAVVSAHAAVRDRDPRHAAMLAVIALLAARHGVDPPLAGSLSRPFDPSWAPLLLDLAVNMAVWCLALAFARSLHERNRAEQVQWRDMETLRELAAKVRANTAGTPEATGDLLAHGCHRFEFETGLLVRMSGIEGDAPAAEIVAAHAPEDLPGLTPGPCPALARTLAARCAMTAEVVAIEHASAGHWSTHPEHAPFGWESFLGMRIDGGPEEAHVLCFADRAPRSERLIGAERIQVSLMASLLTRATPGLGSEKPLVPALPMQARQAEAVRLDRVLRQLEPRLRRALAPGRELELAIETPIPQTELATGDLERVVASMLLHAADASPDDAVLTIRSAAVEAGDASALGFATVSIHAPGPALDANALAALYERGTAPIEVAGLRNLPLRRVVRLLRDAGGDLSMESEAGVGTTLTAFVPTRPEA